MIIQMNATVCAALGPWCGQTTQDRWQRPALGGSAEPGKGYCQEKQEIRAGRQKRWFFKRWRFAAAAANTVSDR
jgi:hypothetical protein